MGRIQLQTLKMFLVKNKYTRKKWNQTMKSKKKSWIGLNVAIQHRQWTLHLLSVLTLMAWNRSPRSSLTQVNLTSLLGRKCSIVWFPESLLIALSPELWTCWMRPEEGGSGWLGWNYMLFQWNLSGSWLKMSSFRVCLCEILLYNFFVNFPL